VTWIEQLAAAPPADLGAGSGTSAIGYDLGEAEMQILHLLLRQRTPQQIVAALNEEYDDSETQSPEIVHLCESLAASALFRHLLPM
jgi:hypothetical protein